MLRLFGILTIIGISAVLLVVGYSNDQLTPIVGYLFGKDSSTMATKAEDQH